MVDEIMAAIDSVNEGNPLSRIIISAPRSAANAYKKIVAIPIMLGDKEVLQFSFHTADKVFHYNLAGGYIRLKLEEVADLGYKQWEVDCGANSFKLLVGKKGNVVRINEAKPVKIAAPRDHNRSKNYVFKDGEAHELLIALGLMSKEGRVFADKQKKFRQINKFLEIMDSVVSHVPSGAHVLDFGCGKSYLTFALYYYLNFVLNKNVKITGLDLKEDVIKHCNDLAASLGYENLHFHCGDVGTFDMGSGCDMMITLHACDTATDFALNYAVKSGAKVIISVPCCQHELFSQIESTQLAPLLKHGILKERFSALLTDALRGQLLEALGYKVSIMEFIDMEHTAKNVMIRAVKMRDKIDKDKLRAYHELAGEFSAEMMLCKLVREILSV